MAAARAPFHAGSRRRVCFRVAFFVSLACAFMLLAHFVVPSPPPHVQVHVVRTLAGAGAEAGAGAMGGGGAGAEARVPRGASASVSGVGGDALALPVAPLRPVELDFGASGSRRGKGEGDERDGEQEDSGVDTTSSSLPSLGDNPDPAAARAHFHRVIAKHFTRSTSDQRSDLLQRLLAVEPLPAAVRRLEAAVRIVESLPSRAQTPSDAPVLSDALLEGGQWSDLPVFGSATDVPWDEQKHSRLQPLSSAHARSRLGWHRECIVTGRTGAGPVPAGEEDEPYESGYYALKKAAFRAAVELDYLWEDGNPLGLPQAFTPFHAGPWIEDYWYRTFKRPVRRNMTVAEWEFQTRVLGITGLSLVNQEVPPPLGVKSDAHAPLLLALRLAHDKGEGRPVEAIHAAIEAGAPLVEVEEAYDFDLFYPYVPLFVPWERLSLFINGFTVVRDLLPVDTRCKQYEERILASLDLKAAYITVVQRAGGITMRGAPLREWKKLSRRTLVLNSGGGFDIPLPLFAGQLAALDASVPFEDHLHAISFVGTVRNGLREAMASMTARHPNLGGLGGRPLFQIAFFDGSGNSGGNREAEWVRIMADSLLQLAPRGTNPSSFRLYEALQMGLIPVYVWEGKRPFLPFNDAAAPIDGSESSIWSRVAFVVHIDEYEGFLDALPELFADSVWYDGMRASVIEAREHYFTYEGVMRHVYRLLLDPSTAELKCSPSAL
jgi:hypothetical protein